jgi:hypothetical protein
MLQTTGFRIQEKKRALREHEFEECKKKIYESAEIFHAESTKNETCKQGEAASCVSPTDRLNCL